MFDVNRDVNQTAAIVYEAKSTGHKSSVFILGGVRRKTSCSRPSPQIQEVHGIPEKGHDYFLQCTDARPDTGGLSGATPAEAVSWGKVDPDTLPIASFATPIRPIALPLLTACCLSRVKQRRLKRLLRSPRGNPEQGQNKISKNRHCDENQDEPPKLPSGRAVQVSTEGRLPPGRSDGANLMVSLDFGQALLGPTWALAFRPGAIHSNCPFCLRRAVARK